MELIITSKKHGKFLVHFDDDDKKLINGYTWCVLRKKSSSNNFYVATNPNGKIVYMHHMVLGNPKLPPKHHVDHIDLNPLNNRKDNLRIVTVSKNCANSAIKKNNTIGYKGVVRINNRFYSQIKVDRKIIYSGRYDTAKEAAIGYNEMAIKYFGECARLNDVTVEFEHNLKMFPPKERIIKSQTGYIGVNYIRERNRYIAYYSRNGVKKVIGRFKTAKEAAIAYNNEMVLYSVVGATLNKI